MKWFLFLAAAAAFAGDDIFAIKHPPEKVVGIEREEALGKIKKEKLVTCKVREARKEILRQELKMDRDPGDRLETMIQDGCRGGHKIWLNEGAEYWFSKNKADRLKNELQKRLNANGIVVANWEKHEISEGVWPANQTLYTYSADYYHTRNFENCLLCKYTQRNVERVPGDKIVCIRKCLGHREDISARTYTYENAKENLRKENEFLNRAGIPHNYYIYSTSSHKFKMYKEFKHPDLEIQEGKNAQGLVGGCDHYVIDEVIERAENIEEKWVDKNRDKAIQMEKDPRCHLISVKNGKPGTRNELYREAWERELVLECVKELDDCNLCRKGVLLHVERKKGSDPILWYDLATYKVSSDEKDGNRPNGNPPIYGINGEFDEEIPSQGSDFPQTVAAFVAVSQMYQTGIEEGEDSSEPPRVFKGVLGRCRCKFHGETGFIDCCMNNPDDLDPQCSDEERALSVCQREGACIPIGETVDSEGNTVRVFCCFASKIARIVREAAEGGWGDPNDPKCDAIKVSQIRKVDLLNSGASDEFQIDYFDWEKKIEKKLIEKGAYVSS